MAILSQEQINELKKGFIDLLVFSLQQTELNPDQMETITNQIGEAIKSPDFSKKITSHRASEASFDVLGVVTDVIPGDKDDAAVDAAEKIIMLATGNTGAMINSFIERLKERRQEKRKRRRG